MDIFLLNVVRLCRMVTPIMQAQGGGTIVNISSAWAGEPTTMFPTSGVMRAGLSAFAKMYADTYAAQNIRMNIVLPGWIDSRPHSDERRQSVPMQRFGTAEAVASAVAWLVSDDASYVTGQGIRVDGGLMRAL
jgi:NAD(P)-dependent dehydrogenase (short-subunit alcohol dehydrogenase family)